MESSPVYGHGGGAHYGGAMPYGGAQSSYGYGQYGGADKMQGFQPKPRRSVPFHFLVTVFFPWVVFAAAFSLVSLPVHYSDPSVVAICLLVIACAVLGSGYSAAATYRTAGGSGESKWYMLVFASSAIGLVIAILCGQQNYATNVRPFMDVQSLNAYHAVDPSRLPGQQVMDAGRIEFKTGARLDLTKSIGFKNLDYYCVAPVAMSGAKHQSYDYWAVGTNCCTGRADFHCGDYLNGNTLSGLRLMRAEQRDYFRLAVQQAEASYGIHANHPIFLHWMQDPLNEIEAYINAGYKYLLLGFLIFFLAQLVVVIVAAMVLSNESGSSP